jgi:hypothetical protein
MNSSSQKKSRDKFYEIVGFTFLSQSYLEILAKYLVISHHLKKNDLNYQTCTKTC